MVGFQMPSLLAQEQDEKNDDRQGDTKKPEKNTATHVVSPVDYVEVFVLRELNVINRKRFL